MAHRAHWAPFKRAAFAAVLAAAFFGWQFKATADDYPNRVVELIVPFPPGGGVDTEGRVIAQKLSEALGKQVIVVNKPGAGSVIGVRDAAKAAPDGYTILMLVTGASLPANTGYDLEKDFAPVGLIATSANLILVRPGLPAHSLAELIALAKQAPGKLNFASTGTGTSTHLAALLFAGMAGVTLTAIPYKGVAPAVTDLLGEHVDLMFCPTASIIGLVQQNKLRALAVTSAKRSALLPQVPSVAEAGLAGYQAELHYGLVAPAGTPRPIVEKLNAALNAALADADIKNRLAVDGAEVLPGTPEAYGADIAAEEAKWSAVIKKTGVKAE